MADKYYNYENSNACSSSSGDRDHHQSDEMSLFLRQILLRPPSSPPSYMARAGPQTQLFSPRDYLNRSFPLPLAQAEIPSVGFPDGVSGPSCGSSLSGSLRRISAANVPSSLVGGFSENETDECESEEGLEALIDEVPAKSASPRKSSKRSRAAEVHNLSEKRRRSRINEKMKALQNLIPNSNKTDKASMLDEAIEYLQQLQLQVQMLSLRNGISLYPISMPGLLQPLQLSRMEFGEENGPQHAGMAGRLSLNQESLPHAVLGLQNKRTLSNQQALPDMSRLINSETTFSLESSFRGHFGPFPLHASSQEICRDDVLQHHQLNANLSERKPESVGARAKALLPFETKASNLEDSSFAEACMIGRDQTGGLLMKHLERNHMPSQDSDINSEACWTDVT